jgi:hypothetical protein
MFEKRLKEITDRKLEIRTLITDDKADLKAIKDELDKLEIEERSLKEKQELVTRISDGSAEENGEVRTLEKPKVEVREMDFTTMSQEDILKSTEYRSAYLKNLQGKTSKGTVFLPIQASITDQNGVEWGGAGLNEIERKLANLSLSAMMAGNKDVTDTVQKQFGNIVKEIGNAAPQIRVALAGEAVGIQNLLSRFGQILNPNLELLFTGPTLRPFNFSFKMSARSQKEGEEIRNIINFFKKNMAPKGKAGEIFLRSPNTFFIEYNTYDNNGQLIIHPSMNLIKECALTNCSVDYTPMGTHMTYEDNMRTLVSYNMTLTFQELEPIYDGDYAESNNIQY